MEIVKQRRVMIQQSPGYDGPDLSICEAAGARRRKGAWIKREEEGEGKVIERESSRQDNVKFNTIGKRRIENDTNPLMKQAREVQMW